MSGTTNQASSASTAPVSTGNTILPPPRLTGNPAADALAMQRWLQLLYSQMIEVTNVIGQLTADETSITTLQTQMTAAQADIAKIKPLVGL